MIPVICIIILPLSSCPEKKSGLEIRKSCLSGHGNWRWSKQCSPISWKLQQLTGHLTITCARGSIEWGIWTGNVSEMEECLFRRIACLGRTSKVTHYIRTALLKVWWELDRVSYFCSSIADQHHVKSGKSWLLRKFFWIHNLQTFILW